MNRLFLYHDLRGVKDAQQRVLNLDYLHQIKDDPSIDKEDIERKYIDMVAKLAGESPSKFWWAGALSEKSSLNGNLFVRLYIILFVNTWLQANGDGDVVIVCQDLCVLTQLRSNYASRFRVKMPMSLRCRYSFSKFLKVIRGFLKVIVLTSIRIKEWSVCRHMLQDAASRISTKKDLVVIRTWMDHRAYASGRYEDPYFKTLPTYFKESGRDVLFFAGVLKNYREALREMKQDEENFIIPSNFYLNVGSILSSLYYALFKRPGFDPAQPLLMEGINVREAIQEELLEDIATTMFFRNLLEYYSCRGLCRALSVERFIYTFENYAWEKLSLLAIKETRPRVKTVGFQHAFIAKNSFKYFPGRREAESLPLPDKIVAMGRRTKDILERFGSYPTNKIIAGCALRQDYINLIRPLARNARGDIFVPLAIAVDDTVKVIRFLFEAGMASYPRKVYLRLHPATPVKIVLRQLGFDLPTNFIISDNPPILREIERSSVVLYTSTTVCLEALKMGRPVIYLDVNFPLEIDPLFECSNLKQDCRDPSKLIPIIEGLVNMEEGRFAQELNQALDYLSEYFYPVNEKNYCLFTD